MEVPVLKDITFHLEKGDKTALVGINGAGKTTLLRILTGALSPDSGEVTVPHDLSVGYLAQDQGLSSDATIYEEAAKTKRHLAAMEEKIRSVEDRMATVSGAELSSLMEEYHAMLSSFDALGGYTYKSEIPGVLKGLGFSESDFDTRISTLSGGQKTRVALAKLLLQDPALIILDEPTNHLDIGSIRWLENYIRGYKGTVLIVSHDRFFLDRTVNRVLELENGRMTVFGGNYSAYAEKKKALRAEQQRAYLNNRAVIKHQEEVIAKLKSFNREKSIKRAESREKMLAKMQVIEKPADVRSDMHLTFTPVLTGGRDVLHVERLAKSFGEKRLFSDVGFDVRRGEHIAVIGSN
ncbi:MAG: ABC-F family ATP-binding cassette domain-containing protein, partial [Lachnospiraceae bacterium]|nr:ABC-F family ATP-binding cassette domain-containing protein [Lachnospiraceae bacterium]